MSKIHDVDFSQGFLLLATAYAHRSPDANERARRMVGELEAEIERARRKNAKKSPVAVARIEERRALVVALANYFSGANLRSSDDPGPTPETLVRNRQKNPIRRLEEQGRLEPHHVRAADQIAWVVMQVTRNVTVRSRNFDTGAPGTGAWRNNVSDQVAEVWSKRYRPWQDEQKRLAALNLRNPDFVLDVVVFEVTIRDAESKHRLRHGAGTELLRLSLDDYYRFMGEAIDVSREIACRPAS